jgi:recombination protein RecT
MTTAISNSTGNAVSAAAPKTFRDLILMDAYKASLAAALPKHLTADRMVRVVLTALNRNPKLLECTKESLWQSVMDCASLGLEPDALGRAYLVPYENKRQGIVACQLIIGYKGLIDLMYRSERINMVQTGVVHKGDHWLYERGMAPKLEHRPCDEPGSMTHVYSVVHLKGCDMPSVEVMTRREVDAIKGRSRAAGSGPWVTDYEAMAVKTCIRRHSKVLPMSAELARALDTDADQVDLTAAVAPAAVDRFAGDLGGEDTKTVDTTAEQVRQ